MLRRTLLLTRAHLRAKRGQTAVLMAFTALTGAVLTLGLVLALRYPAVWEQAAERAHIPHVAVLEQDVIYSPAHLALLEGRDDAVEVATEPVFASGVKIRFGDADMTIVAMLVAASEPRSMDLLEVLPGAKPLDDAAVYLPYVFSVAGGYQIGDTFLALRGEDRIELRVAGFTDEAVFGSLLNQWYRLAVSTETLALLKQQLPDGRATLITARFSDPAAAPRIAADYATEVLDGDPAASAAVAARTAALRVADWEILRQGHVFFADILAVVLITFAAITGVVALIMIRFRVLAQIEDSMAELGVLKAVGYTSGQLAAALVTGAVVVVGGGAAVGAVAGNAALPGLAAALSAQSALTWQPGFDWAATLICVGVAAAAGAVVAGWACWRLRKLVPLTALRSGLEAHDFKRDRLPLARLRLRFPTALTLKAAVRAPARLAMIALVVAVAAFMATASAAAWYNMGVDRESFWRIVGGEIPDVAAEVADPADAASARAQLEALPEVRQAIEYGNSLRLRLGGDLTVAIVTGDFSKFEGTLLYRGRFPVHGNEVAISARHGELLGVGIGDEVRLEDRGGGGEAGYLVTGLIQTMNEGGAMTAITSAGLERIWPGYPWTVIGVYLHDSDKAGALADELADGGLIDAPLLGALNLRGQAVAQLAIYGTIMAGLAGVMVLVAAAVTALVLVGVLGTAIRRQRSAFGVQRALGFTSGQLIWQVAATYWPPAALGAALGCAAGWALFPSLIGALFKTTGIYSVDMAAPVWVIAALATALAAFALVVTLGLASRARQVPVYALVAE